MAKIKGINNDGQNTTQKIKDGATPTQLTTGCDLRCSGVNNRCHINFFSSNYQVSLLLLSVIVYLVDRCLSFGLFFAICIVLSVLLLYTDSDYPFGNFKLFSNAISIIYISPEFQMKTYSHEHTFVCTAVSNR